MQLEVSLPNHAYTITIASGSLSRIGQWLLDLWQLRKVVIITDYRVGSLYADVVKHDLQQRGFEVAVFSFPAGESYKQLETVEQAYRFLAQAGLTRTDGIVALGGGVVGDLAGFVASTYMRGLAFVQVPTSLIAQVDASIGGKTAVNTAFAKNMVGTIAQPDGVLIDPNTLLTLDERDLRQGMAEVIKAALIGDKTLWNLLEGLSGTVRSILEQAEQLIYRACQVKCQLVMADERDKGVRQYLNFGHTLGHALELAAGYGNLMHGEAVAIGMVAISRMAEQEQLMPRGLAACIEAMCQKFGLPVTADNLSSDAVYQALLLDKKAQGSIIHLVLLEDIGQAKSYPIALDLLKRYLEK